MAEKVDILGVNVSRLDLEETIERMSSAIDHKERLRIAVTPVNCLLWARKNPSLRHIYNTADIVAADGVPVVWASRLCGYTINGRVTGLDLLPRFAETAAQKGYSFFFLGAAAGVAELLAAGLMKKNPGLKIAGTYSPPYAESFSLEENDKMIELINDSGADVLWVSLTAPKQDFWIAEHFARLQTKIAVGVGAAFDVVAGKVPRAPVWMQRSGFEWFFRLMQEPGRLASRYLIEAPVFFPLILKQAIQTRFSKHVRKEG
ncbi:MAG: glycosyltransferase [Balneolaceae bacterium]|nr:MAG: glycosyltransferase [Balneolaceae bacterium]